MHRRPLSLPAADICWKCQWRIANQHRRWTSTVQVRRSNDARRAIRAPVRVTQFQRSHSDLSSASTLPEVVNPAILDPSIPVRDRLRLWQQEYGRPNEEELAAFARHPAHAELSNGMSLGASGTKSDEGFRREELEVDEAEDEEGEELITIGLFLKPGDVVEVV